MFLIGQTKNGTGLMICKRVILTEFEMVDFRHYEVSNKAGIKRIFKK